MNDINRCPNHELLVTYLYDECEPAERGSIAAHLALCASCAEDVQGLRDARVHLAAWSPPALPLGFQLTRTESEPPSKVLHPAGLAGRSSQSEAWWRQPLPAWAQAAAAAVIFAAGMSLGAARSGDPRIENAVAGSDTPAAVTAPVTIDAVSRDEFERLAARLLSVEHTQTKSVARTAPGGIDERELLARVNATIDARIAQSERQNISRLASAGRSLEAYRDETAWRLDAMEEWKNDVERVVGGGGLAAYQTRLVSSLR